MNKIENEAIKEQIYLEKYKNWEATSVLEMFDKANREIARFIKQTSDVATKKRYTEIARELRDVAATLKENIGSNIDIDGLITYEIKKQKSILNSVKPEIQRIKGGEVNFLYPSKEQIKSVALFKPADKNMTYQSYLDGIEAGLYNTWDSAIRTGYLAGIPTKEIVDSVIGKAAKVAQLTNPGSINALRNSVYSNTRTVLQAFANETRERIFEKNEEYFGDIAPNGEEYKYEYLATLDTRTCLVCGAYDGKLFKTLKDCPQIPQHRGCRCIIIPYFNIENDERSSKDGYKPRVTFDEWIKQQNKETKIEVLGPSRYKKLESGIEEGVTGYVENGSVLNLDALEDKERKILVQKIETGCDWFNSLPSEVVTDFKSDLMNVKSEQLNSIFENTKTTQCDFNYIQKDDKPRAYFSKQENKMYLNIKEKSEESEILGFKTNMVGFLHESGHAIDNYYGLGDFYSLRINNFINILRNDSMDYCRKVLKIDNFSTFEELIDKPENIIKITNSLVKDAEIKCGINDIWNGLTRGRIAGAYGRENLEYWDNYDGKIINVETVANFFDARGCGGKKLEYMQQYFSEGYKTFEGIYS